jgi:branched-subunit amino acid ABC-type transport system permease component
VRQLLALAVTLTVWEAAGRAGMLNPLYFPAPSRIAAALVELFSYGTIWAHLEATFAAAIGGLVLGLAEVFSIVWIGSGWRDAVAFSLLFAILFIRPQGLFGRIRVREV